MEAPPENFAYTLLLSPDFSQPDALAVIDAKPGSPTFSTQSSASPAAAPRRERPKPPDQPQRDDYRPAFEEIPGDNWKTM
jgi:hypothetical protein